MTTPTLDVKELRVALAAKNKLLNAGIANAVKIDGENVEIKTDDYAAMKDLSTEVKQITDLIETIEMAGDVQAYVDAPEGKSLTLAGARDRAVMATLEQFTPAEVKSLGEMFLDSDEFKDMRKRGSVNSDAFEITGVDLTAGAFSPTERKDVFGATTGAAIGAHQFGRVQFDPMVPRPHRRFRVRDLFPSANTDANLIDYFRVLGYAGGASAAASVKDRTGTEGTDAVFGIKPKSNLIYESKQAPVRTIAHWEAAHRNVLDDAPQLRASIDNELLYGLRLEEDRQILSGSGNNDELRGILLTTGIQTYVQPHESDGATPPWDRATEPKSDSLRRAATKVLIANYENTGFVLHPNDWEDIELQRGSDGHYMLFTNVSVGAQQQIWRVPVVDTVAIAEGTFLAGAFGLGANLYDRQIANVRTAEQHADFFVRNAIVILVEERLALAVKRPEAFVKGTFWVDVEV